MLNCTGNVEWIFFHLMVSESKYNRISFNGHYWNDINMYANLKSKLNFVCRNKPVPVVALLWSDISDLDLEKIVCHFFSTSAAVLRAQYPWQSMKLEYFDTSGFSFLMSAMVLISLSISAYFRRLGLLVLAFYRHSNWIFFSSANPLALFWFFPSAYSRHSLNFLPLSQKRAFVG